MPRNTFFSLQYLNCRNNRLNSLPSALPNVMFLDCRDNMLTELPNGMLRLETLKCDNNVLNKLPNDLLNITELSCSNNQLTMLPLNMEKLNELHCAGNNFKALGGEAPSKLKLKYKKPPFLPNDDNSNLAPLYKKQIKKVKKDNVSLDDMLRMMNLN
jgi:Leucine-rich repeat (LRR) protein